MPTEIQSEHGVDRLAVVITRHIRHESCDMSVRPPESAAVANHISIPATALHVASILQLQQRLLKPLLRLPFVNLSPRKQKRIR